MNGRAYRFVICFAFVFGVLGYVTDVSAESDWELVQKTDDGISVKAKETSGTNVRAVSASLKISAPPQTVIEAAADPKTFEKNGKYLKKHQVFRDGTSPVWHVYYLVKFPIITERDYTLRYEQTFVPDKKMHQISWHTSKTVGPAPLDGVIRVTLAEGWFRVTLAKNGSGSILRYYVLTDPGGSIPSWLVNLANRSAVPNIMRQVRDASLSRVSKQP